MTYSQRQRLLAAAWKKHTGTLPDRAKALAAYVTKGGRPRA
jgi:hypothetical protein